jgi:hypothetical protein
VNLDWDTTAIVPDTNLAGLSVHRDLHFIHVFVTLFVVGSIDNDLVEDFVKTWHKGDFPIFHRLGG